jgi:uncharacterized membrane protein
MKKTLSLSILLLIVFLIPLSTFAEEKTTGSLQNELFEEAQASEEVLFKQDIFRAKILNILEEKLDDFDEEGFVQQKFQWLQVKALDGIFAGQEFEFLHEHLNPYNPFFPVEEKDTVVIYWNNVDTPEFSIENKYRLNKLLILVAIFFILVILFTRLKGIRAIISLMLTLGILIYIVVPQIANGTSPILISLLGALLILAISIFFGHGFRTRSIIAFLSAVITIGIAIAFSYFVVHYPGLTGYGAEDAFWLNIGTLESLDIQGLLLAGIIISIVGILDDVTIVQASLVEEIYETDKSLTFKELYKKGMSVGKEHIISMVNTLVIIYAGVALPIFLYISHDNYWGTPLWARLNQDSIVEEIARSLAGSASLLFAVPITTLIAAYLFSKRSIATEKKNKKDEKQ